MKKKSKCFGSYQEFVFTETGKNGRESKKSKLDIGSRPFETKSSYMAFLDTFVSISFTKVLEKMEEKGKDASLPFLRVFAKDIVDREMAFYVQRVSGPAHRKHRGLSVLSGDSQAMENGRNEWRKEQVCHFTMFVYLF